MVQVEDAASLLAEANQLFLLHEHSEALALYKQALDLSHSDEGRKNILVQQVYCLIAMQKFSEAQQGIDELMKLDAFWAHMRKGELLVSKGKSRGALDEYKEALKLNAENDWLQNQVKELNRKFGIRTEPEKKASPAPSSKATDAPAPSSKAPAAATIKPPAQRILTAKDRIKFNQYFMNGKCYLSILGLRNIPNENRLVEFVDEDTVRVTIKLPELGDEWKKEFDLYGKVNPSECSFRNAPPKIEIVLDIKDKLADPWPHLEKKDDSGSYDINKIKTYPSSKKSHTDWDKLDSELKEEEKDSGNINALFQKIYADADEDTRKAMLKSYSESGGTVLSTNWNEVGSKKVEPSPPTSMEAKKYDQ